MHGVLVPVAARLQWGWFSMSLLEVLMLSVHNERMQVIFYF